MNTQQTKEAFGRLYDIIITLRAPGGCAWDRAQTAKSIRGNLIEEAYECVSAINNDDVVNVCEEIGDIFLVASMLAVIYEEQGSFTCADAILSTCDKLVRRHPHVFPQADGSKSQAATPEAVLQQWNDIKEKVEGRQKKDSVLDSVSKALPPLERAHKIQLAAAKTGFDWPDAKGAWDKLDEEIAEARTACLSDNPSSIEDELGDVLFSVINVARKQGIDPSVAMHKAVDKFSKRFKYVEKSMKNHTGLDSGSDKDAIMDKYWEESKTVEL